jgi:hypothetical protein
MNVGSAVSSPIISNRDQYKFPHGELVAYGINLESRMLDKILYVVGKSDMPLEFSTQNFSEKTC